MCSGDAELEQSFREKVSWQDGKSRFRAVLLLTECQHQRVPGFVGFEWSCPSAALRPDGRYHSPMEEFQGSETNKISSKEEMLWLYCFATLENVSFYFENCFLWFAVRNQTVSLDLFPRHTVLGNFTFTFECKLLESVSSLAWNSKIKSKWDGFLWNEKAISLLISCNLVMSYSDKCFYYVLS